MRKTMKTKKLQFAISIFWCCCLFTVVIASANKAAAATTTTTTNAKAGENLANPKEDCTDLARDEETLMVFSTLGGGLTAIDPITSEIRWTIADEPPIRAEQQQSLHVPQYLPDPRDGSIYQLGDMGSLKKLPYTIPQLVASAPCRSSDGILYSGKKSDTWFAVDPKSGRREKIMGFGEAEMKSAEAESVEIEDDEDGGGGEEAAGSKRKWGKARPIYLGRTQYTVMMYDSQAKDKNAKPCNVTFYDYSAHSMTPDISKEYEYLHLTSTSSGNIVTLDRKNGKFLWKRDLTSPVVAAFLLGSEGLLSVPFTTVSDEAFDTILEESKFGNVNTVKLFQSLYVGEHGHGLYALPSLMDKNTPRISTAPPIKLLDGPHVSVEDDPRIIYLGDAMRSGIVLGHYNMPIDDGKLQISPPVATTESPRNADTKGNLPPARHEFSEGFTTLMGSAKNTADIGVQTGEQQQRVEVTLESTNALNKTKKIILANSSKIQAFINEWFMEHPSGRVHQILIVLVVAMVTMFWYMCSTMRELKMSQSENGSKTNVSTGSSGSQGAAEELVDLGDGHVRVGKISFNCNEVLGKGCEGTFVFKGTFEQRFVAVKRLLPECFTFADREVALLRESDAHENVVRYFCTEQDRQFRYIAVELCAATLQDYTEGERSLQLRQQIDVWEVLRQAAAGLTHLHSLNIVHRDIKPQNVLLSHPDVNGQVRVMISDFGLCKKLNFGKTSFSRRSGVTGTDGWIAPEMMRGQRTTTAVDIFSLGCVYYYVLSGGHHAFGDALKRQANILSNEYNLSKLEAPTDSPSKFILAEQLIADMIHKDAQCRPPANCIGQHPIFWNNQKILAFLQDVSDRVEKLQFHAEPLKSLEKNGSIVVLEDWNLHLDPSITEDLRKYRGYMGASVRDLLRALRNKKHHYHELSEEMQNILGCIPHEFTNYWITKFPQLIQHAYHALSICAHEPIFKSYYSVQYRFTRPDYFMAEDYLYPSLLSDPKPLPKQSAAGGGGSPKQATPTKQRKGTYNFRKSVGPPDGEQLGIGLQRNLEAGGGDETAASAEPGGGYKRDVYANFKFRRNQKPPTNRNFSNYNKEKHVIWTLPSAEQKDNGANGE